MVSQIPVFIAHSPLLAHEGPPENQCDIKPYREIVRYWNDELLAGLNAVMLEQPAETITHRFYTKREFSVGSTRLDIGDKAGGQAHPESDRTHMNKKYGLIYLSQYLSQSAG
jgi:hypothetical protein